MSGTSTKAASSTSIRTSSDSKTEKATFDVPSPSPCIVKKILKPAGQAAAVGETIAHLEPAAKPASTDGKAAPAPAAAPAAAEPAGKSAGHVMPTAPRVMAEAGLKAGEVKGTGPGGRVLKEDAEKAAAAVTKTAPHRKDSGQADAFTPTLAPTPGTREERRVPMTPIRQTIAQRLVEAQQTAALLTTFNEVDMSAVMDLRNEHKDVVPAEVTA